MLTVTLTVTSGGCAHRGAERASSRTRARRCSGTKREAVRSMEQYGGDDAAACTIHSALITTSPRATATTGTDTLLTEAQEMGELVLRQAISGLASLITSSQLINVSTPRQSNPNHPSSHHPAPLRPTWSSARYACASRRHQQIKYRISARADQQTSTTFHHLPPPSVPIRRWTLRTCEP